LADDRFKGFVFNVADLGEDVQLDVELRKEILFAEAQATRGTLYDVLGLKWGAGAEAAKIAYVGRVKVFHPDRYPGKRLGSYRGRLERVFKKLTEAKDVLCDEGRRRAYQEQSASPEEKLKAQLRRAEDEKRSDERRARLAKSNPLVGQVVQRAQRVAELLQRGKQALSEGRFSAAANDFFTILGIDPNHAEAKALGNEARSKGNSAKANEAIEKAVKASLGGRRETAVEALRAAVEAEPTNPKTLLRASRVAMDVGAVEAARQFADAAVRVAPRSGGALEALGIALEAEGRKDEARKALERALELDPQLETSRERLKKLKGILGFLR
jgi:tetratricopeptide (TPR) repeat protein